MWPPPTPEQLSPQRSPRVALPTWYPGWAREPAVYIFPAHLVFVVHGNIHDLSAVRRLPRRRRYLHHLSDFSPQVFGAWDLVAHYDLGRGLRPSR
jgi:hypothetical protein